MGGKISKHDSKRYRVRDNLKPVRWNYLDDRYRVRDKLKPVRWNYFDDLPINQDDPMHDPTYHLQGEPDENNGEIYNPDLDVWLPRVNESSGTTYTVDDDACGYDSGHFFYHETVLQETLPKSSVYPDSIQDETNPKTLEQPDHYDVINDLEMDLSDTEQKQPMSVHKDNDHANVYHGFPKRRANYEQMVKIFKPLIVKNVNVKRLLPHLPFLYNVECKIRAIEERDPHAAIIYLIDELCSGSNTEPGRWRQFMQALEACGYKCIVDTLRGEEPVDHTYQRQYLKIITPVLRELIVPQEVVHILWAYNVISSEDKEEIVQTERMVGSIAATDKLLDMIPRRHKFWYSHFVDALSNAGRYEAADLLAIPEILDSEGEKVQKCSDNDANIDDNECICREEISTTLGTNDYLEMMEDHQSNELVVTERCKNLDCSKEYSDDERDEIDELYMKMRKSENKPEIVPSHFDNSSEHSFEIEETLSQYEEYHHRDLSGEYRSLTDMTSKYSMSISEPPQIPQRRWNKQYSEKDANSLKVGNALEIDIKYIKANSSDTNSVEVIKLTTPEPTRCYFPDHTPLHSNKVKILNKPPVPTPRKRISYSEGTTKSLQTCSEGQQSRTDKSGTPKSIPSKPSNTEATADYSEADEAKVISTLKLSLDDLTEEEEEVEGVGVEEDIFEEESKLDRDPKRCMRSKTKSTIRKRKNRFKFFGRSKLNSRRKPLKISSAPVLQTHIGVICKNQRKKLALANREKLPLPTMNISQTTKADGDVNRSKSLPTNIEKVGSGDEQSSLTEATGQFKKKEEISEAAFSYSEPFRCFRGKEDDDIFATVGQFSPSCMQLTNQSNILDKTNSMFTKNNALQQSRDTETEELLDILESCNSTYDDNQVILKSNTEIKNITKDNLNPELRKSLEKVRDLELKLNYEIHNGKVLKKTLQLQGDVNEVLKQNRQTLNELSVKEKESKALEAATTELYISESASVYECQLEDKTSSQHVGISSYASENKDIVNGGECYMENTQFATWNKSSNMEKIKTDTFDKDSAFCSELTTKF